MKSMSYIYYSWCSHQWEHRHKSLISKRLWRIGKQQGVHHESIRSKNEVGDTAQWCWKNIALNSQERQVSQGTGQNQQGFSKDCNQPATDFYYMVDGNNNPLETWMNFDISVGNDLIMVGNFSAYSVLINRQQMGHSGMRRVCAIEWGHIIENGWVNEKAMKETSAS